MSLSQTPYRGKDLVLKWGKSQIDKSQTGGQSDSSESSKYFMMFIVVCECGYYSHSQGPNVVFLSVSLPLLFVIPSPHLACFVRSSPINLMPLVANLTKMMQKNLKND